MSFCVLIKTIVEVENYLGVCVVTFGTKMLRCGRLSGFERFMYWKWNDVCLIIICFCLFLDSETIYNIFSVICSKWFWWVVRTNRNCGGIWRAIIDLEISTRSVYVLRHEAYTVCTDYSHSYFTQNNFLFSFNMVCYYSLVFFFQSVVVDGCDI